MSNQTNTDRDDTNIRISRETHDRLEKLKPFQSMTHDETLKFMLDMYEKSRKLRFMGQRTASTMMSLSETTENGGSN